MNSTQTVAPSPAPSPKSSSSNQSTFKAIINGLGMIGSGLKTFLSIIFYIVLISFFLGPSIFDQASTTPHNLLWGKGDRQIAVIDINGIILDQTSDNPFSTEVSATPRKIIRTFEKIKDQPDVAAIVIRINSPGGSVTASDEMYQIIKNYKQQLNIPIVISMADTAASGGYYVALAGDHIVANPTTLTGSIGVIVQTINFEQLAADWGVQSIVISSGDNKDLLNPFNPVDQQQLTIFQSIVDQSYDLFLQRIAKNRDIDPAQLRAIADGRILSGQQAYDNQLVDSLGTFQDTITMISNQLQLDDPQVIVYGQSSFLDTLIGAVNPNIPLLNKSPLPASSALSGQPAYIYLH